MQQLCLCLPAYILELFSYVVENGFICHFLEGHCFQNESKRLISAFSWWQHSVKDVCLFVSPGFVFLRFRTLHLLLLCFPKVLCFRSSFSLIGAFSPKSRPGNPSVWNRDAIWRVSRLVGKLDFKNSSTQTDKWTGKFGRVSRLKPVPTRFHTKTGNSSQDKTSPRMVQLA